MAKVLQFRRGTAAELDAITGAEGELFVDLDSNTIRVHDGSTAGGVKLGDYNNLTNKPDLTQYDNVDFHADQASLPASGETYKIYVAEDTGYIYRWTGSAYSQIGGETPTWGSITGTLSSQTDLQSALNAKADSSSISAVGISGDYNDLTNKPDLSVYDEVLPYANLASFPASGATGKVYVDESTGYIYRWSGSAYVQLTDQTAIWGQISGTLSSQSDLQSAINAAGADQTITLGGDVSGTGTTSISVSLGSGVVGADELNVSGNGTAGQALLSDGDGSFSWGDAGGGDPTITTSSTNSNFKVPFANTTTSTTGQYGLLQDTSATFTYNPGTDTLVAGNFSGGGAGLSSLNAANISTGTLSSSRGTYGGSSSSTFVGYTGTTRTNGYFYGGSTTPNQSSSTYRLNYNGPFYAYGFYGLYFSGNGSGLTNLNLSNHSSNLYPGFNNTYDVGTTSQRYKDLYLGGSINLDGSTISSSSAGIIDINSDVVTNSVLADKILISENVIRPDDSTAREYFGTDGVLVVEGNLSAEGEWLKIPVANDTIIQGNVASMTLSSGPNTNEIKYQGMGAGDGTLSLQYGGRSDTTNAINSMGVYNGISSTWSSGSSLAYNRLDGAGAGTSTNAFAAGGKDNSSNYVSWTEVYNGSFWTTAATLVNNVEKAAGVGTGTRSLIFGGLYSGGFVSAQAYNGVSWSTVASPTVSRRDNSGLGSSTDALAIGGYNQAFSHISSVEKYNGTTWSTVASLLRSRASHSSGGIDTSYGYVALGQGDPFDEVNGVRDNIELWNGINWSTGPSHLLNRFDAQASSSFTSGVLSGGRQASNYTSSLNTTLYTGVEGGESTIIPLSDAGEEGMVRYNAKINNFQKYVDGSWKLFGTIDAVDLPGNEGELGQLRFNKSNNHFEGYNGTAWVRLDNV